MRFLAVGVIVGFVIIVLGVSVMSTTMDGSAKCDPSYPTVCIAQYPPDLDCGEIPYVNFKVIGSDKHGFDADHDGIGCER